MLRYSLLFLCIFGFCSFVVSESSENFSFGSTFLMPEVLVTAPRFEYEDESWSGLMPEVTVTAPRCVAEDKISRIAMSENRPDEYRITSQTSKIDSNTIIIFSVLGSVILFVGLIMFRDFLRKADVPTK